MANSKELLKRLLRQEIREVLEESNYEYREVMNAVDTHDHDSDYSMKLQIQGSGKNSKWLNISKKSALAIADVLKKQN